MMLYEGRPAAGYPWRLLEPDDVDQARRDGWQLRAVRLAEVSR